MSLRALVVNDQPGSAAMIRTLEADRDIETGASCGFAEIMDEVRLRRPDIVVMLPENQSQALTAIEQLMARQPVPILVIGDQSLSRALALKAGAVEVVATPAEDALSAAELRLRVRLISRVNVIRHIRGRSSSAQAPHSVPVVGIAASTGGPQAVVKVLRGLAGLNAAVLVVQHLHPDFIASFRDWMERESPLPVEVAVAGSAIQPGRVYLAPSGVHLMLGRDRNVVLDPEPASLHRPSADILFKSLAVHAGAEAVGVLLTGMGDDGAAGLLEMRLAGARTIAQDEGSSAVYGMPQAANVLGAAEQVLSLERIPSAIMRAVRAVV
jgi:two-component system chemotaxis response regulator CheB